MICYGLTQWVNKVRRIDDSLDVLAVHGVGGMTGVLLTSFLASESFVGLRVSREDEAEGLDIAAHGERAYELQQRGLAPRARSRYN